MQVAPVWSGPPLGTGLEGAEVRAVEVASDGSIWLGVRDRGLARIEDDSVTRFTTDDGLASNGVTDLLQDSRGRIWVVGPGGYSVYDQQAWTAHSQLGSLTPRIVFSVREVAGTGAIWFAANGGAARLESGNWSVLGESDGLPHRVVHFVVEDPHGVVWLGCRTGLARRTDGNTEVLFPQLNFRSGLVAPDGSMWFGTSEGVLHWDGTQWHRSLEGTITQLGFVTSDGTIWAGTSAQGVFRLGADGWERIDLPPEMRGAEVFDLAEESDGSVWVATSLGVARISP